MGLVHCLQDSQTFFFNKIFIKNGFYASIHIFKNYFATLFSVFNFQQNDRSGPKTLKWNEVNQNYQT